MPINSRANQQLHAHKLNTFALYTNLLTVFNNHILDQYNFAPTI